MTAATATPPRDPVEVDATPAANSKSTRQVLPAGPNGGPAPPFPLHIKGPVVKGFGRGSKELHIPTANIPVEGLAVGHCKSVESGVYFGWARLDLARLEGKPLEVCWSEGGYDS